MKRKVSVIVLSMLMTLLCSCDGFIANHSIPEHSPGMPDKTTTNRFSDYDKFPLPYETALKVSSDGEQLILSKQQALEDYDALWEMLEDNYPYFETIKNELGLDWREVRDTYRTELISVCRGSSILQDNYINVINNCLNQFESIRLSKAQFMLPLADGVPVRGGHGVFRADGKLGRV